MESIAVEIVEDTKTTEEESQENITPAKTFVAGSMGEIDIPDFLESDILYQNNWRLVIIFLLVLPITVFFDASYGQSNSASYALIAFSAFLACLCLSLLLCAVFYSCCSTSTTGTARTTACTCEPTAEGLFRNSARLINRLFNPEYMKINDMLHEKLKQQNKDYKLLELLEPDSECRVFLLAVCTCLYGFVVFIVCRMFLLNYHYSRYCFGLFAGNKDGYDIDTTYLWNGCTLKYSSFGPHFGSISVFMLFFFFRKANLGCQMQCIEDKKRVRYSFKTDGANSLADSLDENISKTLDHWKRNQFLQWKASHIVFLVVLCVLCVIGLLVLAELRTGMFTEGRVHSQILVGTIFMCVCDGVVLCGLIFLCTRLCRHFDFPSVIMESMMLSMSNHLQTNYWQKLEKDAQKQGQDTHDNGDAVNGIVINEKLSEEDEKKICKDLHAWSKLRHFYTHSVIPHMSCSFEQSFVALIVFSLFLCAVSIYQFIIEEAEYVAYMVVFFTCLCLALTFLLCRSAVRYLAAQEKHITFLKQVRVHLVAREANGDFIDHLQTEIESTVAPMTAFGLRIDSNFMSAVSAFITAFVSAILVEALFS